MPVAELTAPSHAETFAAGTAAATVTEPLRLELSLAESVPWPGLVVRAAVRFGSALLRLRKLEPASGGFHCNGKFLEADKADALIVHTLLSLPTSDHVAFRALGEQFAPVLVLLRQASGQTVRRESDRIAALKVLTRPPQHALAFEPVAGAEGFRVRARPSYRVAEGGANLGWPAGRGNEWWSFEDAICAAPPPLPDRLLRKLFEHGEQEFSGELAYDILRAAREAMPALSLTVPPELEAATTAPLLQPAVRIETADAGPEAVHATLTFEAPAAAARQTAVSFSAAEILEAVKQGEPVVRRGKQLFRVDAQTVAQARDALTSMAKVNGTPGTFDALGEQIPELLRWAKLRQVDAASPWNVYLGEAVTGAHLVMDEPAELRLRLDAEEDGGEAWFTVSSCFEAEGRPLSAKEIEQLLKQRRKWLRDGSRWVRLDPAAYARKWEEVERFGLRRGREGEYRFRAEERAKVGDLFSLLGTVEHSERYRAFLERLKGFDGVAPADPPRALKLTLRPYQAHGYNWLRFLTRFGLNGILADDMGLGKTAQAIALLAHLREEHGTLPSLVVCPTSLVDNWRNEAAKFAPHLKVMRYTGSPARRDRLREEMPSHDLALTTYATARNDAALLKDHPWRCVILDEAHTIKNAAAVTTKAIKTIPAQHRLALTGTPVQNRLDELWSLFDFLMPGYLGRHSHFFHAYEEAVVKGQAPGASHEERSGGDTAAEALRRKIGPFVLRRLKSEVARDLPEKIEQHISCMLTADQVALYRKYAQSEEARKAVRDLETKGAARCQTQILAALTNLRKICNHPDLVYLGKDITLGRKIVPLPGYEERGGKLPALADLLDQCQAGGHRALIFCQLTSMLDILEHFLNARGEKFLRLDGSTPAFQRQALVDQFNKDASLLAFLISTRAGGSGLNLTGADTVIFYDHDWNPANDSQAQDRAYRIGQTRNVNVYRLVTKGTLEEKILERQALKQNLADAVVHNDTAGFKELSKEELLALFTFEER